MLSSRGSFQHRDQICVSCVSCTGRQILCLCALMCSQPWLKSTKWKLPETKQPINFKLWAILCNEILQHTAPTCLVSTIMDTVRSWYSTTDIKVVSQRSRIIPGWWPFFRFITKGSTSLTQRPCLSHSPHFISSHKHFIISCYPKNQKSEYNIFWEIARDQFI